MRKNTALIEETMRTSYKLFENLKSSGAEPGLTSSALSVAKDIHEIKKEYLLIMRGISEALDEELKSDGMHLEELLLLLKDAMALVAKEQDKELLLTLEYADNPYTDRHYALMSIFRNLFINAIEAAAGQKGSDRALPRRPRAQIISFPLQIMGLGSSRIIWTKSFISASPLRLITLPGR